MTKAGMATAALLIALAPGLARAQAAPGQRIIPGAAFTPMNDSIAAMNAAMARLNDGTSKALTGDTDHNFITRMLAIQQAQIDLSEAEMKYGTDAKLKQQAARAIAAQQHDITTMQAWLDKHPAAPMGAHIPPNIQWK